MEGILAKLLVPDNQVIEEGTKELKEALKKPESIGELCSVIQYSQNPQLRQTATVVLRRKISRERNWSTIDAETKRNLKNFVVRILVDETHKPVKNGIAQIIGLIAKYDMGDNSSPELIDFIFAMGKSNNILDRALAMYTLSIMTEMSHGTYIVILDQLSILFRDTLNELQDLSSDLAYYTVMVMNHLVPICGGHQQIKNIYCELLPRVIEIINTFSTNQPDRAIDCLCFLEELVEYAVAVIIPHIQLVINTCLKIATNNYSLSESMKIKAVSVVGWLIRSKAKVIQKHNLVEPIIDVLLHLMAIENDNEEDEYFVEEPDEYTATTIATQTLDLIALNIPADLVVDYVLKLAEPAMHSSDQYRRKAAYLCLAVLAEGCSECIRHKYLESFLKCIYQAMQDSSNTVRNAAFFALGQFAEHLQPEISKFAVDLMPILMNYLSQLYMQMDKERIEPNSINKLFYALEMFCENLDDGLMPYLPTLMERLMHGLDPNGWSIRLQRSVLGAISAATTAVKSGMLPYYQNLIEILNVYINADPEKDIYELKSDAIDCLSVIIQFIGVDHVKPLSQEALRLAMQLVEKSDDPDIKRSVYGLLASLATVLKGEMTAALPLAIEDLLLCLKSTAGIEEYHEKDKNDDYNVYGDVASDDTMDEEDLDDSSDSDSSIGRFKLINSFNEEKEQALLTLKEICIQTGPSFLPYLERCFEETLKLLDYPQENIRRAAIETLLQFCIGLHKVDTKEAKEAFYKSLRLFIPKCGELVRIDEERLVVNSALDCYGLLLDEVKGEAFVGEGHKEAIMNCIIDILNHKTLCQDTDVNVSSALEDIEDTLDAEQDEILLESACDVIPKFGAAMGAEEFTLYFPNILKLITIRTSKKNSISQRSFAFGSLAECMKSVGIYIERFAQELLHLWSKGVKDPADEVRQNATFGLGEMILHGKDKLTGYYQSILQGLSPRLSEESHAGTLDNLCGVLAKMIIVKPDSVPLEQVFPALLQRLPLREDFTENEAIIKCFYILYQNGHEALRQNIELITNVIVHVVNKSQLPNTETTEIAVNLLKSIQQVFPDAFNKAASQLTPDDIEILKQA